MTPGFLYKVKEGSSPIQANKIRHYIFYLLELEKSNNTQYLVVQLCFLSTKGIVKDTWSSQRTMETCQYERIE